MSTSSSTGTKRKVPGKTAATAPAPKASVPVSLSKRLKKPEPEPVPEPEPELTADEQEELAASLAEPVTTVSGSVSSRPPPPVPAEESKAERKESSFATEVIADSQQPGLGDDDDSGYQYGGGGGLSSLSSLSSSSSSSPVVKLSTSTELMKAPAPGELVVRSSYAMVKGFEELMGPIYFSTMVPEVHIKVNVKGKKKKGGGGGGGGGAQEEKREKGDQDKGTGPAAPESDNWVNIVSSTQSLTALAAQVGLPPMTATFVKTGEFGNLEGYHEQWDPVTKQGDEHPAPNPKLAKWSIGLSLDRDSYTDCEHMWPEVERFDKWLTTTQDVVHTGVIEKDGCPLVGIHRQTLKEGAIREGKATLTSTVEAVQKFVADPKQREIEIAEAKAKYELVLKTDPTTADIARSMAREVLLNTIKVSKKNGKRYIVLERNVFRALDWNEMRAKVQPQFTLDTSPIDREMWNKNGLIRNEPKWSEASGKGLRLAFHERQLYTGAILAVTSNITYSYAPQQKKCQVKLSMEHIVHHSPGRPQFKPVEIKMPVLAIEGAVASKSIYDELDAFEVQKLRNAKRAKDRAIAQGITTYKGSTAPIPRS